MFSEKFGWQPIDTAPIDKDVMLFVTDGRGEPYAVYKWPAGSALARERLAELYGTDVSPDVISRVTGAVRRACAV